jgi:uncharacterized protein involved in propanediol utilization
MRPGPRHRSGSEARIDNLRGDGSSCGSFGELLQGALPGADMDFLVTFPIALYSRASFSVDPARTDEPLSVHPEGKRKALALAQSILAHHGFSCSGRLEIESAIPEGKGLASSSADLVATARALVDCFRVDLSCEDLEGFLRGIEPTDGVMYPGSVAYYHRRVELREIFGPLPPLTVLSVDQGDMVDTVEFNRKPKHYGESEKREYEVLLESLKGCISRQDALGLGRIATRSAVLNQRLNPKRHLDLLLHVAPEVGAHGVIAAHSGTCAGLLFSGDDEARDARLSAAMTRLSGLAASIEVYHSWGGGPGQP